MKTMIISRFIWTRRGLSKLLEEVNDNLTSDSEVIVNINKSLLGLRFLVTIVIGSSNNNYGSYNESVKSIKADPQNTEQMRYALGEGIERVLNAPWYVQKFIPVEGKRILKAMKVFFSEASEQDMARILELYTKEQG